MPKKDLIVHVVALGDWPLLKPILLDLVKAIESQGRESKILILGEVDPSQLVRKESMPFVQYLQLPSGFFASIGALKNWIQKSDVGVVHIHDARYLAAATWAAVLAMRPRLATIHSVFEHKIPSFIWRRHKKIIFAWQYVQSAVLKLNRIPLKRIAIIADGGTSSLLHPNGDSWRKKFAVADTSFVIANVGRLAPEEDQASLLKAFRKIIEKKVDAQLFLIGEGPLRETLQTMCKDFKIESKVAFLPESPLGLAALQECDCLAQTTIHPGLYRPIVQAMAYAKPVIATKMANHGELIEEGKNGFLVPCAFPERMEAAVMRLYANRSLGPQMGQAGLERFREVADIHKTAEKYLQLYQEI